MTIEVREQTLRTAEEVNRLAEFFKRNIVRGDEIGVKWGSPEVMNREEKHEQDYKKTDEKTAIASEEEQDYKKTDEKTAIASEEKKTISKENNPRVLHMEVAGIGRMLREWVGPSFTAEVRDEGRITIPSVERKLNDIKTGDMMFVVISEIEQE